ncbi:hypothetical protein CF319_g2268 [Tilletia indica]|nr:hypothetical protein CF319_g2268 [Tilletia indica]
MSWASSQNPKKRTSPPSPSRSDKDNAPPSAQPRLHAAYRLSPPPRRTETHLGRGLESLSDTDSDSAASRPSSPPHRRTVPESLPDPDSDSAAATLTSLANGSVPANGSEAPDVPTPAPAPVTDLPTPSQAIAILQSCANASAFPTQAELTAGSQSTSPITATKPALQPAPTHPAPTHSVPSVSEPIVNSSHTVSSIDSNSMTEPWPLKDALKGTQAQFYRGPLSAQRVMSLLGSKLSKNGRISLTGTRAGYLAYFHFLGPVAIPTAQNVAPPPASSSKVKCKTVNGAREIWRCKVCHSEFQVPQEQVSNLGIHLYGAKSRPQRGCLDIRGSSPAEAIPAPARDAAGKLVRISAGKPTMRAEKKGKSVIVPTNPVPTLQNGNGT